MHWDGIQETRSALHPWGFWPTQEKDGKSVHDEMPKSAGGQNKNTHNIHQAFGKPKGAICEEVTVKFLFKMWCLFPLAGDTKETCDRERFSKFEYGKQWHDQVCMRVLSRNIKMVPD